MKTEIEILREQITKLCEIAIHVGLIDTHATVLGIIESLKRAKCRRCDKLATEIAALEQQLEECRKDYVKDTDFSDISYC